MAHKTCVASSVGDEYEIDNKPWKVTHVGDNLVKLRCVTRGYEDEFTYFKFNAAVFEGDIKIPKLAQDGVVLPDVRLADLPDHVKKHVFKVNAYIRRYSVDKQKKSITGEDIIAAVVAKIFDTSPPSLRTVQRWVQTWVAHERHWIGFVPKKYLISTKTRMDPFRDALFVLVVCAQKG
jgi:hypothetical protein